MSEKRSLNISKIFLLKKKQISIWLVQILFWKFCFSSSFCPIFKKRWRKVKNHGFLGTHTNSRTNFDHILVKKDDYVKYGFIPKWKKILPRVGFEPAMLRMGPYLKQWPTKWILRSVTELWGQANKGRSYRQNLYGFKGLWSGVNRFWYFHYR